jgi:hypothetical protein
MEHNNDLLSVLTREGVLIKVSVRYWRGTKKLKPEDLEHVSIPQRHRTFPAQCPTGECDREAGTDAAGILAGEANVPWQICFASS